MRPSTSSAWVACVAIYVASSCSNGPLTPQQFAAWTSDADNGLLQKQQVGDFTFQLIYQPPELLAIRDSEESDALAIQKVTVERKGAHYFTFRLRNAKTSNLLLSPTSAGYGHQELQYYFSDLIQEDLFLIINGDTLPCAQAHFERNYGASPYNNITASFIDDAPDPYRNDIHFVFDDRAFGVGPVRFTIRKEDLLAIPALKTI